ncbi:hypothetical protein PFICI_13437 [Pestalotiopsis fici W106-1]|uniref:Uncharacterized protein n=1 Tax=Pestalotiopsis fici (strain W106-1 / CGMCC3.15140) TaxID=1229662 RepID=W3WM53_PESFW|nr:uncharacterized protein PFICI_13437 [Pestalotiopsis fici W106-1]ETS74953.1 hypothetical protein PFICI_13437 [Pestalotiopsis fici W106-1]
MSSYRQHTSDGDNPPYISVSSHEYHGGEQPGDEVQEAAPAAFPRFQELPAELRTMVLQERLDEELIPPIQTLTIMAHDNGQEPEPHVLTRGIKSKDRGLWHTGNRLVRAEVERRCCPALLPVRQLTDPGSHRYLINQGLTRSTPERHRDMGQRPMPRGTVFYVGPEVASMLLLLSEERPVHDDGSTLGQVENGRLHLDWLENLLLDHHTFRVLLRQAERTGNDQPFRFAPNLRTLYLGFGRRWTEVVMIEARSAEDTLLPVRLLQPPSSSRDDDDDDVGEPTGLVMMAVGGHAGREQEMHGGLTAMIMDAARQSLSDVRALEASGLQVRWVVVRDDCMVRRKEFIALYDSL